MARTARGSKETSISKWLSIVNFVELTREASRSVDSTRGAARDKVYLLQNSPVDRGRSLSEISLAPRGSPDTLVRGNGGS